MSYGGNLISRAGSGRGALSEGQVRVCAAASVPRRHKDAKRKQTQSHRVTENHFSRYRSLASQQFLSDSVTLWPKILGVFVPRWRITGHPLSPTASASAPAGSRV